MEPKRRLIDLAGAVLATAMALLPAAAPGQIATVSSGPSGLSWRATIPHDALILTIGGNGHALRTELGSGEMAEFALVDEEGHVLPDGLYKWELRIVPPRSTADALAGLEAAPVSSRRPRPEVPAQSGSFRIMNGALVDPERTEPPAEAPFVTPRTGSSAPRSGAAGSRTAAPVPTIQYILDDLSVAGSECLGFDCLADETFNFDTLRLKENNLQIAFVDTSSVSGFPTNDWRIRLNDEVNGGAEFFTIEDDDAGAKELTLEPGAPDNAIYLDSSGYVGFGTSIPLQDLHAVSGDTPALRLEQTGDAQTWDVGGNEASFFVRDVTNGSETPLEIEAGAPTGSLVIGAGGVSIGAPPSVPDFVFEPEYELLPLAELRHFVTENHHLPSVPAAREIQAKGLQLGEFQMALLQKVEELTLYTLEQEELIAALTARLAKVEAAQAAAPAETAVD